MTTDVVEVKSTVTVEGIEYEAIVAEIERTFLGVEDHGLLTMFLHMKWGSSGQSFGGRALDWCYTKEGEEQPRGTAAITIRRCCEVVGVDSWEKLAGKHCYLLRTEQHGWIDGIMNLTDSSRYFLPGLEFKREAT